MGDRGQDISSHFTNQSTVVRPTVQRVNVDFTAPMLEELDRQALTLNISRRAVIKTLSVKRSPPASMRNRLVTA